MQTTKSSGLRGICSRPDRPPLSARTTKVLPSNGKRADLKTPERPIAATRNFSSSKFSGRSISAESIFSESGSSASSEPESPITPPTKTTPNSASRKLKRGRKRTTQASPSRSFGGSSSKPAGIEDSEEDENGTSSDDDHLTTDQASKSTGQPHGMSRTSLSDDRKYPVSSRPRIQRRPGTGAVFRMRQDWKPKLPGAYVSQDSDTGSRCSFSEDDEMRPATRLAIDMNEESSSSALLDDTDDSSSDTDCPAWLNFTQHPARQEDARAINYKIQQCLLHVKQPVKDPQRRKPGWIYIFESPKRSPSMDRKVKIGKSDRNPDVRKEEWEKCGIPLREVKGSYRNAFDHYSMVESLIKKEFYNSRKEYWCPRHKISHNEWYEVDRQLAMDSIKRWRDWIISQHPFDEHSNLTPYWRWRACQLPKTMDNVEWVEWLQPGHSDYLNYQLELFRNGYQSQMKAHLERKDFHFGVTGIIIVIALCEWVGATAAMLGFLALLAL